MNTPAEVKWGAVIAVAGQVNRYGITYTEEALRRAAEGCESEQYRYDEASRSLIYEGWYTGGDWGRAVYTHPPRTCLPRN